MASIQNASIKSQTLEVHLGIWLEKSFLKKFHDSCPPTANIATRFAESIPSLKNLRPMPGEVLTVPVSGCKDRESLQQIAFRFFSKRYITLPAHV